MVRALLPFLLLIPSLAAAASPTVAVMPFRDLAGASPSIGEAIRETVTTDLKQLSGLRVIERGALDKVLAELNLQARSADLDPASAAKVGKLLGATLMVAGAYQKAQPQVRLTARFVKVETGEIVGTAKVDGKEADFLRLQDRVTAELLRSAGLGAQSRKMLDRAPSRKAIKSLRTVELYGEAVLARDDDRRRILLQATIAEDADFGYAVSDLAALEKRLKVYQARANEATEKAALKATAELRELLKGETDSNTLVARIAQLMSAHATVRHYRQMAADARAILDGLPRGARGAPAAGGTSPEVLASMYLVTALDGLGDGDGVLREGESHLRRFPSSLYFMSVKSKVEQVIERRKQIEEGKRTLPADLERMASAEKWDLCRLARVYRMHRQHRETQRLFRACLEVGTPDKRVLFDLVLADIEVADWARAREDMARLEREDPALFRDAKGLEFRIPGDG